MLDKTQYWINLAREDMSVAECLLKGKKYLPMGFFCHLITEKALKAIVANKTDNVPPKTHKLKILADRGGIFEKLSEKQLELLDELDPLQIEARYPEYKSIIAKTLTAKKCERLLKETREFLCWIEKELEK